MIDRLRHRKKNRLGQKKKKKMGQKKKKRIMRELSPTQSQQCISRLTENIIYYCKKILVYTLIMIISFEMW